MVIAHKSEARRGFRSTNESNENNNNNPSPQQRPADRTPQEDELQRNIEAIQEAQQSLDDQNSGNMPNINFSNVN